MHVVTATLATVAALLGFLAGPVLLRVAHRAVDREAPLLDGDDRAAIGGAWAVPDLVARITTASLAGGSALAVGASFTFPAYLWFVAVTVILTITDINEKLIPNRVTLPAVIVGGPLLIGGLLLDGDPGRIVWVLIGALGYGLYMLLLALLVPRGMGMGDAKLAPILGGFVAAPNLGYVLVAVFTTHLVSGLAAILLLAFRGWKRRKDHIPFGPYMVIGAYVALFFGRPIIDWYLG